MIPCPRRGSGATTRRLAVVGALLCAPAVGGAEALPDDLQLHGFASQAVTATTANRWFGASEAFSLDFTEVAVNASLRPRPNLLLAGQVLARRAGRMADGTPALDYGLLDLALVAAPPRRLGVRLGRIKNPLGLYNETRDVPFARPGIFLPQVVYQDRFRNSMLATDGAMIYGEQTGDRGRVSLTLGIGQAVLDQNVEWVLLNTDAPGHLRQNAPTLLASLWYHSPDERLRLGLSGATLGIGFAPERRARLTFAAGDIDVGILIASAQYDRERFTLAAEYSRQPLSWRGFGPLYPDIAPTAEGYYVQGTWRLRPNWQWMLRAENGVADVDDRSGARFARATGGAAPPHFGFTRALTTGLRWDIRPNWMLRAEYSWQDGTFVLSQRENPDLLDQARHWDLFSVLLAVRF